MYPVLKQRVWEKKTYQKVDKPTTNKKKGNSYKQAKNREKKKKSQNRFILLSTTKAKGRLLVL